MPEPAALSPMDKNRFGVCCAKAAKVTTENLPEVIDFCQHNNVELLIARCPAEDLPAAQAMERVGGQIMDTLVYFSCHLRRVRLADELPPLPVRPVEQAEATTVARIAAVCFHDYQGHYHADPRLDRRDCDNVYVDWAQRSCLERGSESEVLVAVQDTSPVGFATLRMNTASEGEGVLFAVSPSASKRGVYQSFMVEGMRWCIEKGATKMSVSTQLTNTGVQRVWTRLGFEPHHASYTFHTWFAGGGAR